MPIEIERKYLITSDTWRKEVKKGVKFKQGYLAGTVDSSVRIRVEGDRAFLNIKSATLGIKRKEYEYAIPLEDAEEILINLCEKPLIEKQRFYLEYEGHTWEIDEFEGENKGLIVAEIELNNEDEKFILPDWVGMEVSDEAKYYNVSLVKNPFKSW